MVNSDGLPMRGARTFGQRGRRSLCRLGTLLVPDRFEDMKDPTVMENAVCLCKTGSWRNLCLCKQACIDEWSGPSITAGPLKLLASSLRSPLLDGLCSDSYHHVQPLVG